MPDPSDPKARQRRSIEHWGDQEIAPGERANVEIHATQRADGVDAHIPVHVWRGLEPGPTVFVTAAIHGDEINGTGVIRDLIVDPPFELKKGALLMVPVVNLPGFERHERYMPDRRDLNRSFPGSKQGSMASRIAAVVFREIVQRADFGIDLHTAAVRRTNVPNVRGDLARPEVLRLARAFGTELVLHTDGAEGSLRRTATEAGCPTIILEAGEPMKVEPTVLETAVRGIHNVLIELGMVEGVRQRPHYRAIIRRSRWVRAERGGFLRFHAAPGDLVEEGEVLATNTTLLGQEQARLVAPENGVLLGMTTHPMVVPGDAVYHLGLLDQQLERFEKAVGRVPEDSLHERVRGDLSTSVHVDLVDDEVPEAPASDTE
ncbi:MAG: succinate dehydrogenase [Planctomycetes bacterium]|nr:succinate dehydrogenase [Planctomycetota bacterium]